MNIVGVIPARYASTRLPGKPIVDICGKPMIWWVYNKVKQIKEFQEVCVAIDDDRIQAVCDEYSIPYIYTSNNHPDHICRIQEVSTKIDADYYVCINGDEPLITEECIVPVLPNKSIDEAYFGGAMRKLTHPAEVIDFANIKLIVTEGGRCLYMSRAPLPYPRNSLDFNYYKYVGVECFNRKALDFFVNNKKGYYENIEDIDHLRFLENNIPLYFTEVQSTSLSVDTPKDLEFVRQVIGNDNEKK